MIWLLTVRFELTHLSIMVFQKFLKTIALDHSAI